MRRRNEKPQRTPAQPPQDQPKPGFPCQACGTRIQMTIEDLLRNQSFQCVACGLEYTKDAGASAQAMELLQDVHIAARQLEEIRRDPLKGR